MFLDNFLNVEDVHLALSKVQGGLGVFSSVGKTFWVDGTDPDASDSIGRGTFSEPFATIAFAIGQCQSKRGDVILVKPNHVENLTTAGQIDLNVEGVTVRGMGWTTFRPTIKLGNAAAHVKLSAPGCILANVIVETNAAGPFPDMVYVDGGGCIVESCRFQIGDPAYHPNRALFLGGTPGDAARNNGIFLLGATTASTWGIFFNGSQTIVGNYISGNFTTAAIASGLSNYDVVIAGNMSYNANTAPLDGIISLGAGSSGIVANNVGFHGDPTSLENCIEAATCGACENYFTNVAGESGGIAPPTRST